MTPAVLEGKGRPREDAIQSPGVELDAVPELVVHLGPVFAGEGVPCDCECTFGFIRGHAFPAMPGAGMKRRFHLPPLYSRLDGPSSLVLRYS